MQAHDALEPSSQAEYDALTDKVRHAQEAWSAEHLSLEGFYEAHRADMDRLHEMHALMARGRRSMPTKQGERLSGIVPIALQLDAGTHKTFKAYCKRRRTTMAAMLRAYVLKCVESEE